MLHSIQNLIGFTMGATDGEIGKVKDFYFDDETWRARYLIVETGSWLFGRKVLLSPVSLQVPDWDQKVFPINLTKEQIKNSPDINADKPVSRQQEIELHNYYGWPYYGGATGMGYMTTGMVGGVIAPGIPLEERIADEEEREDKTATQNSGDPHLRSCKNISGYTLHTTDGELGELEDFLIDSTSWNIPFLIAETGSWYSGKKILIATKDIKNIEWESSGVYVDRTKDSFNNSPEFDYNLPISKELEQNLHSYYQSK